MDMDTIALCENAISDQGVSLVEAVLSSGRWGDGPMLESFEQGFARWIGRQHAVAVGSGTLGTWITLRAMGIGPGDEVICASHTWHQVAQAITLAGATPVFADINYWSGCLSAEKAALKITPATKAILAGNTNGHPAAWKPLRELADAHCLKLIEDSTESLGSRYLGQSVGTFGDVSVFDFSMPSALCTGEGGMLLTDDEALAIELRYLRQRRLSDRASVSIGSRVPLQAGMSELTAALGLAQLSDLDERLLQRKQVEAWYHAEMQSFEGVKPPYLAEDVDEVHWMLYLVHLGHRFTASAVAQIVDDLRTECIEAALFCQPLHQQHFHTQQGWRRGQLPLAERIADRALALPLHGALEPDQVRFIVQTLKDSSINVGAGAAIY